MTATTFQLVPDEKLHRIEQHLHSITELLKHQPVHQFQHQWIESTKVPPLLGISRRTWQTWRDKRTIPFSQFGSKIYVKLEDINKLLESHRIETR